MKTDSYITHLKALEKEYSSQNVSLLIGAGFSKNALPDFPNWNQLLSDMVVELFKDEFINNPSRIIKKGSNITVVNKDFKAKKIQEIIDKIGYLEIVSLFLKKRGMREAVEIYIEERTPYIDQIEGKFIIPYNNTTVEIESSALSVHEKVLEGKWEQIYTTNYDNLLEYVAEVKSKGWKEISNGYDLSFSDTKKNIIKIHGSLRSKDEKLNDKKFEFDSCYDHCYIITKEDYENYSTQHEAFAQLMRISLLKGVFCLIGFSGNDPNFLSWIKWVKDILIKSQKLITEPKIKVYVVTIDDKEISKELKLYYANHHICIIPLRNKLIKNEINAKSDDSKQLIQNFLEYIYESSEKERDLYLKNWLNILQSEEFLNEEELLRLSLKVGFKTTVSYQKSYLNKVTFPGKAITLSQLKLAILAVYDIRSTFEYYRLNDSLVQNFNELPIEYQDLSNKINNRNNTLLSNSIEIAVTKNDDASYYEEVLRCAFRLDFDTLNNLLENWNPNGIYVVNKASILSLFDISLAKEILLDFINNNEETEDNKYLGLLTLNSFRSWGEKKYSITNYKNQNLEGFFEIKDELLNDVLEVNTKIKPYGTNTEQVSKNRLQESVRIFNFFLDVGPQINFKLYTNLDSFKWYQIFKQLYLYYPYPCFYFSLQFSTEDILIRIGQDYAYSDALEEETEFLLTKSLNNLIDNKLPEKFIKPTYLLCSQLLSSVSPNKWEKFFMKIWEDYLLIQFENEYRHKEIFKFIKFGLPHLRNTKNKIKIISDCISYREKSLDNSIYFLYYLSIKKIKLDETTNKIINDFIINISKPIEINIAGNINNILSPSNKDVVSEKVIKFLKQNLHFEDYTLYTCSYFLKRNKQEMSYLKNYILNSKKLWNNGINSDSASEPDFLHLSRFESSFKWDRGEIEFIYSQLKISLDKLLKSGHYKNDDGFFKNGYVKLMDEMLNFIDKNNTYLSVDKDFKSIVEKLKLELDQKRGFTDINEGLLSEDSDILLSALNLMHRELREKGVESCNYQLNILTSRFLNKRKEGLQYCFVYLNYFITKYFPKKTIPTEIEKSIIFGIDQYDKDELIRLDLDVPKMSKHLISLSRLLHKKGKTSDGIQYWIKFKNDRRFN